MIQFVHILTKSDKSLLFRNYGTSEVDRDLLSNFLNILSGLIEEIGQSDIKNTQTEDFKYFYTTIDRIFIVVCTDLEDDDATVNSKILSIRTIFIEKYGEVLESGSWAGNRTIFYEFEKELDNLILGAIKIAILGFGGVGKDDLVRLICGVDADLEYVPTITADIASYEGDEFERTITLWNFAGLDQFHNLWKSLLAGTDIVLLVTDSTYENISQTRDIIHDLLDKFYPDKLVIGIANKQDLPNRLTPEFCERILSSEKRVIKTHGMITSDPIYREKILLILKEAIKEISNRSRPSYEIEIHPFLPKKEHRDKKAMSVGKEEIKCERCGHVFTRELFDGILSKIIKSDSGIKKVILTDRTGFTIASVSGPSYLPLGMDEIGAITSANFSASEEAGKGLDLEKLNLIISEFTEGKIFSASVGMLILTLICDTDINVGLIRSIFKRSGKELRELLEDYLINIDFRKYRDLDKDWEDKDFAIT